MEYKRFGSTVVARIDRGEEVLSALKDIALRENIKLAAVSALGATEQKICVKIKKFTMPLN